jgi:thiol-disulfide isomerase/thioredoxin
MNEKRRAVASVALWATGTLGPLGVLAAERGIHVPDRLQGVSAHVAVFLTCVLVGLAVYVDRSSGRRRAPWVYGMLATSTLATSAVSWLSIQRIYALPAASTDAGVGAPLPAVALATDTGQTVSTASTDGKPTVVLLFRGSWCPFCRKQLKEFDDVARRFPGVRVVGVTYDPADALAKMRDEVGLRMVLGSDPGGG